MDPAIGRCDVCGVVDHHRIEGLCSICDQKVIQHADPSLDKESDSEPLGVESLSYMMPSLRRYIGG